MASASSSILVLISRPAAPGPGRASAPSGPGSADPAGRPPPPPRRPGPAFPPRRCTPSRAPGPAPCPWGRAPGCTPWPTWPARCPSGRKCSPGRRRRTGPGSAAPWPAAGSPHGGRWPRSTAAKTAAQRASPRTSPLKKQCGGRWSAWPGSPGPDRAALPGARIVPAWDGSSSLGSWECLAFAGVPMT